MWKATRPSSRVDKAWSSVQTALTRAGINPGPANGIFGAPTEAAVLQFQRTRGLPATGVVDQRTWTALGLKGAVPHPVVID